MKYDVDLFFSKNCPTNFFFDNTYAYIRVGYADQWHIDDRDFEYNTDLFALLLDSNEKLSNESDIVFFNNITNKEKTALLLGDCSSQAGCWISSGQMRCSANDVDLNLKEMPRRVQKIAFIVNVYECNDAKRKTLWGNQCYFYIRKQEKFGTCKGEMPIVIAGKVEWKGRNHDQTIGKLCELIRTESGWKLQMVQCESSEKKLADYLNSFTYNPIFK